MKKPGTRLFAAGDHGGADFFPAEFRLGPLIARHSTVAKWRPVLFAELDAMVPGLAIAAGTTLSGTNLGGGRNSEKTAMRTNAAESELAGKGLNVGRGRRTRRKSSPRCRTCAGSRRSGACGGAFGGLWVQAGTCFRCDAVARSALWPKSVRLDDAKTENRKQKTRRVAVSALGVVSPPPAVPGASNALFFSGCASCGVTRGDGEDVALMAESGGGRRSSTSALHFEPPLCALVSK